jgi:hypothetical protein
MAYTTAERLQARRSLIALIKRRQRPGSGSMVTTLMKAEREAMRWWDDIGNALGSIPHAVVGAVAANRYMPARQTADIDVAVRKTDLAAAETAVEGAGWRRLGPLRLGGGLAGSSWQDRDGNEADLIGVPGELGRELVTAAQDTVVGVLPYAALEHIVMLKMIASRGRDIGDLTSMLGIATEPQLDAIRVAVKHHGTLEDVEDLEQLIVQGRLEHGADH